VHPDECEPDGELGAAGHAGIGAGPEDGGGAGGRRAARSSPRPSGQPSSQQDEQCPRCNEQAHCNDETDPQGHVPLSTPERSGPHSDGHKAVVAALPCMARAGFPPTGEEVEVLPVGRTSLQREARSDLHPSARGRASGGESLVDAEAACGLGSGQRQRVTRSPEALPELRAYVPHTRRPGSSGRRLTTGGSAAIDMLWPCHWRLEGNLQIVLDAIDGELSPKAPFTACGRNIEMTPLRERVEQVCGRLHQVGQAGTPRRWLAASLDKTLRLQLSPPEDARTISALRTPDWL